jgi:hypothetical protein
MPRGDQTVDVGRGTHGGGIGGIDVDGGGHVGDFVRWAAAAREAIERKANAIGWHEPAADVEPGAGDGWHRRYVNGLIEWLPAIGAFEVHGAILGKYLELGGDAGPLGYPKTDELPTVDGVGRLNHFERGSIYWHPHSGAHEVHGAIRDKWAALGWERFGYPTCDEVDTVEKTGRVNHFKNLGGDGDERSIYWTPAVGAFAIQGPIRQRWASLGWERSYLGFPTSDQQETPEVPLVPVSIEGTYFNTFERGRIVLGRSTGLHEYPETIVLRTGEIDTGRDIRAWFELILDSRGAWLTRGHVRNSEADSFDIAVTAALAFKAPDGTVPTIAHRGSVHGIQSILTGDSERTHDWNGDAPGDSGVDPVIRDNWNAIRTAGWVWSIQFDSVFEHALKDAKDAVLKYLKEHGVELAITAGLTILKFLSGGDTQDKKDCGGGTTMLYPKGQEAPPCPQQ